MYMSLCFPFLLEHLEDAEARRGVGVPKAGVLGPRASRAAAKPLPAVLRYVAHAAAEAQDLPAGHVEHQFRHVAAQGQAPPAAPGPWLQLNEVHQHRRTGGLQNEASAALPARPEAPPRGALGRDTHLWDRPAEVAAVAGARTPTI